MATEIYSFLWEDSCSVSSRTSSLPVSVGLDCDRNIVVQQCKDMCKFFIVDAGIAITIYGESLLSTYCKFHSIRSCQRKDRNGAS
jgi:hypothetical protein